MIHSIYLMSGLAAIMAAVLLLPFLSKKVEEELEIFLFIMGVTAVTLSGMWSGHLIHEAVTAPLPIAAAVLIAGWLFRLTRTTLRQAVDRIIARFGYRPLLVLTAVVLGFSSSMITAIIAALILCEVVSVMRLPRALEIRFVVAACFAIGLGAVLTPLGEPLSTIATAKLQAAPHHADFFYLFRLLGAWIVPLVAGLAAWTFTWKIPAQDRKDSLASDRAENLRDILFRAGKVYLFVAALVLLGTGFTPVVEAYLTRIPSQALYWINTVSAVLDNATLAAAEITPRMDRETVRALLLGLLLAGGMLIPGNIPNIICAGKLSIRSGEWAKVGLPLGAVLMVVVFLLLLLV